MFQQKINIPLLDAIKQVPKYAKFSKELCIHKRKKLKVGAKVGATTRTQPNLPRKCRDPGIFSVSCTIGNCAFADAMLNLGASINVMPASFYKSLEFGVLEPTSVRLGILEDVLIQVNELIFPANFYVLDMEDETSGKGSTLILRRPFLMTARTKINVYAGTLSMEFGDNLYVYLDNNQHFPVIIANNLYQEQEEKLLKVLLQHKKENGWKIFNLPRINPSICTHRILMEEEAYPIRRLNLTILDVVKKEVTKLLATKIIYPISDSNWVNLVQVVLKKSKMIVAKNWHAEMHHFPLPFIDQVLEKLAGKSNYYLDGYSGYMQIHIAPEDQQKTTFACPFSTFAYTRMSFGLCNPPSTIQRCMLSIFLDLLEEYMEVFMDDFMVYTNTFEACLEIYLEWIDTNLVQNFEKCHFMVTKGIVLGHLVSNRGIEVNKAKVDVITSLPNLALVREIALPLSKLPQKDVDFVFDEACVEAFEGLNRLTSTPILQAPNWELPFELMYDASNSALGAVLGQQVKVDKPAHVITYATQIMDPAQINYTTMKKELLEIVFSVDKFHAYLLGSKVIVFSNHVALKYLLKKLDAKLRYIRGMLLLQEFNLEIKDKKGAKNIVADHLSRIQGRVNPMPIRDDFPNEQLLQIAQSQPWFADICNFLVASTFPPGASKAYKETLESEAKYYRFCNDQITRRCISNAEFLSMLHFCHSTPGGGHYGSTQTTQKVLDYGFYWPTIYRDAYKFVSAWEQCQRARMAIS
ncbi:Retrovirus-related Pol polyprotein from transposon 17.6, partial [Mucuna pruriens]